MVGKFTYVPAAVYPLIAAVSAGCAASCYIIGRKIGYDPAVRYETRNVTPKCNYGVGSRIGGGCAHRPSAIDAGRVTCPATPLSAQRVQDPPYDDCQERVAWRRCQKHGLQGQWPVWRHRQGRYFSCCWTWQHIAHPTDPPTHVLWPWRGCSSQGDYVSNGPTMVYSLPVCCIPTFLCWQCE